jgi:hypothetical protein
MSVFLPSVHLSCLPPSLPVLFPYWSQPGHCPAPLRLPVGYLLPLSFPSHPMTTAHAWLELTLLPSPRYFNHLENSASQKLSVCQAWWCMTVFSLRRQRQEDHEFNASLSYIVRPYVKKKQSKTSEKKTVNSLLALLPLCFEYMLLYRSLVTAHRVPLREHISHSYPWRSVTLMALKLLLSHGPWLCGHSIYRDWPIGELMTQDRSMRLSSETVFAAVGKSLLLTGF